MHSFHALCTEEEYMKEWDNIILDQSRKGSDHPTFANSETAAVLESSEVVFSGLRKLVGFSYGKKTFYQNSDKFLYSFIKSDIMFMYLHCIYKKIIILSLFNIDTLNFTMYILTNLTCCLKTYVIRLQNLISMNIFLAIIDHSFSL